MEEYIKIYEECKDNKIFLEQLVKQHKDMNKLCETSCNTIRIMTLILDNDVKVYLNSILYMYQLNLTFLYYL